jgi:hypothetical protein
MGNSKALKISIIMLFVVSFSCFFYVGYKYTKINNYVKSIGNSDCSTMTRVQNVRDPLMQKMIPMGSTVKVLLNHYNCNPVKKGDLAFYEFSKTVAPVLRIVQAVPGDRFSVYKTANGKWGVKVNDKPVVIGNEEYWFNFSSVPPLKTYSDYGHGVLGKNEYLVFSISPGLTDSSNLGIVKLSELSGKALL